MAAAPFDLATRRVTGDPEPVFTVPAVRGVLWARMGGGSVEDRVAAVAALSADGWRLSGRALPTYGRTTMPVVLTSLKDHRGSL